MHCPVCNSRSIIRKGSVERTFHALPVGLRPTLLRVKIPRVHCRKCNLTRQVKLLFAGPKKNYTYSLERYIGTLCTVMPISHISKLTGLSWDTVKSIHKTSLYKKYKNRDISQLRRIAIDEFYLGKRQKFITLVMDLDTGAIVHIGKSKSKKALKGFWKRLKRSKAKIEAVSTDMASGYIWEVSEKLPNAALVLDHFHLVKWFNDKLTKLRRELYKEAEKMEKDVLKGVRWLLLKNPENLKETKEKNERKQLEQALELNKPLATAYYMKERLRLLFKCKDRQAAANELKAWCEEAEVSGIKILKKAANRIRTWRNHILNWYEHKISSGKMEATNAKIRTLQKKAYGYRDKQYFKLRLFNLHNEKYALFG